MVPGPDGNALMIKQSAEVMRVYVIEHERLNARLFAGSANKAHAVYGGQFGYHVAM